jgi:hypothetical protein
VAGAENRTQETDQAGPLKRPCPSDGSLPLRWGRNMEARAAAPGESGSAAARRAFRAGSNSVSLVLRALGCSIAAGRTAPTRRMAMEPHRRPQVAPVASLSGVPLRNRPDAPGSPFQ